MDFRGKSHVLLTSGYNMQTMRVLDVTQYCYDDKRDYGTKSSNKFIIFMSHPHFLLGIPAGPK